MSYGTLKICISIINMIVENHFDLLNESYPHPLARFFLKLSNFKNHFCQTVKIKSDVF